MLAARDTRAVCRYSLVGAAAVLGGMARMTISLAVILLESTGDLTFGMPLMVVLMASRWMGNVFNEGGLCLNEGLPRARDARVTIPPPSACSPSPGLYDIHIHLAKFPLIEHKPPTKQVFQLTTHDVMSSDLVTLPLIARVGDIYDMLRALRMRCMCTGPRGAAPEWAGVTMSVLLPVCVCVSGSCGACAGIVRHSGFPVLYPNGPDGLPPRGGNLAGLIYRKHLCVLLSHGSKDTHVFRSPPTAEEHMRLARAASVGAKVAAALGGVHAASARSLESGYGATRILEWHVMEGNFPRYPKVASIQLTEEQRWVARVVWTSESLCRRCSLWRARVVPPCRRDMYVDLRPYFHASPYTVLARAPASQTFRLFRDMGLRHIVVVRRVTCPGCCHRCQLELCPRLTRERRHTQMDANNDAVGVVTRHDLTHSALHESTECAPDFLAPVPAGATVRVRRRRTPGASAAVPHASGGVGDDTACTALLSAVRSTSTEGGTAGKHVR